MLPEQEPHTKGRCAVVIFIAPFVFAAWLGPGLAAGYYLQWPVLLVLTVLIVALMIFVRKQKLQELESIIEMLVFVFGITWIAIGWITYYMVSDQRWIQDFFNNVILR